MSVACKRVSSDDSFSAIALTYIPMGASDLASYFTSFIPALFTRAFTLLSIMKGILVQSKNWIDQKNLHEIDLNSWQYCSSFVYRTFLKSPARFLKLLLLVGAAICQIWLLIDRMENADVIVGWPFELFFYTVSFSLMTTLFLLTSYIFSHQSFKLLQSSSLVLIFDLIASCLYITTSANLNFSVWNVRKELDLLDSSYLNPLFRDLNYLSVGGYVLAGLYLTDALIALKY